jgi:ABC-type sugar transport system permease subunit
MYCARRRRWALPIQISVVIFDAMKRDTRYGYAAALAMLLLIIVMALTVVNNRIASRRVFYG